MFGTLLINAYAGVSEGIRSYGRATGERKRSTIQKQRRTCRHGVYTSSLASSEFINFGHGFRTGDFAVADLWTAEDYIHGPRFHRRGLWIAEDGDGERWVWWRTLYDLKISAVLRIRTLHETFFFCCVKMYETTFTFPPRDVTYEKFISVSYVILCLRLIPIFFLLIIIFVIMYQYLFNSKKVHNPTPISRR